MRAGDFTEGVEQIFDPQAPAANGSRMQFPGNAIPRSRFSPLALKFQDFYPAPNAPGIANNYLGVAPNTLSQSTYFAKLDHSFHRKESRQRQLSLAQRSDRPRQRHPGAALRSRVPGHHDA